MSISVTADRTAAHGGGLPGAARSEWTKLWSLGSSWWMLLTAFVLMLGASAQLAFDIVNASTDADPATAGGPAVVSEPAVSSVLLVQYVFLAFAMTTVTSEYSTGSITTTLQCVPRRHHVMLAKAGVLLPVVLVAGCLLSLAGAGVAALCLGRWGEVDLVVIGTDALRVGIYLALLGAFTLGVSVVLRSAVGSLTTVFLVFAVLPGLTGGSMLLPAGAGRSFLLAMPDPWTPALGLGVLAAWSALALAVGTWLLHHRDA